jgi:hypothetical protein
MTRSVASLAIPAVGGVAILVLLPTVASLALYATDAHPSPGQTRTMQTQEPSAVQILRAADWKGGVQLSRGECAAADGEFTFWVYATATRCGVHRDQADRVVLFRLPTLGVAPLTAKARLPEGRHVVWVYGSGEPGHPWIHLCGKTCVKGGLPPAPAWVLIDWIETRDNQLLFLRTWGQPESTSLEVQAVVLSSSETPPDWIP